MNPETFSAKTITTSALLLTDDQGIVKGSFNLSDKGTPIFQVGETGKSRFCLNFDDEGDGALALAFTDKNDMPTILIGLDPDGRPSLNLSDAAGTMKAGLRISPQGASQLVLCDYEGQPKLLLMLSELDLPQIGLVDPTGEIGFGVSIDADGSTRLTTSKASQNSQE